MKTPAYRGLFWLNATLLLILALLALTPGAQARQPASRPHGQYAMVSAEVQGLTERAVVILDSANQQMVALRWDRSRKALAPLGYRDIGADIRLRERQGR